MINSVVSDFVLLGRHRLHTPPPPHPPKSQTEKPNPTCHAGPIATYSLLPAITSTARQPSTRRAAALSLHARREHRLHHAREHRGKLRLLSRELLDHRQKAC